MIELYNAEGDRRLEHQRRRHRARGDPRAGDAGHRRVQGVHGRRHRARLPAHAGHRRPRPRQAARDLRDRRADGRPADGPPARPGADGPTSSSGFWARGERDCRAYAKAYAAHDGIIWDTAAALLLRLQLATGTPLHLLHTQTMGVVEQLRAAKDARPAASPPSSTRGPSSSATTGRTSSGWARTRCRTTCPRRTPSRCGRRSATARSTSSRTDHAPAHARGEGARLDRRLEGPHGHAVDAVLRARCSSTRPSNGRITLERVVDAHRRRARAASSGSRTRAASRWAPTRTSRSSTSTRSSRSPTTSSSSKIGWTPVRGPAGRVASSDRPSCAARSSTRTARSPVTPGWGRQAPAQPADAAAAGRETPPHDPLRSPPPPLRRGGRPGPAHRGRPAGGAPRLRLDLGARPPRLPPARDGGHGPDVHRAVRDAHVPRRR